MPGPSAPAQGTSSSGYATNPLLVYPFSLDQLARATDGFSPALRVSRKPTFSVYRGQLRDGTARPVMVKVPTVEGDEGAEARLFLEARALSNVRHRNLVELLGMCSKGGGSGVGTREGRGGDAPQAKGEKERLGVRRGVKGDAPRAQALVYEFVDGISLQEALQLGMHHVLPVGVPGFC